MMPGTVAETECSRLKRLALQIAAQLPDDRQEAMLVLEYAGELVGWEAERETRTPILRIIGR